MSSRPPTARSASGLLSDPAPTGGIDISGSRASVATVPAGHEDQPCVDGADEGDEQPDPALIARRRSSGIAFITDPRTPASTSTRTARPSTTTSPIAACHEPAALAT